MNAQIESTTHIQGHSKIKWVNVAFLFGMPVITLLGLTLYIYKKGIATSDVLILVFMYWATGLSITAGYHRLFSHRAYDSHPIVRFLLLIFGAAAFENSALCWSSDHRRHHRFVDTEQDPYNIKKGFFWAHMGWIFYDDPVPNDFKNSPDLLKDKMVMWQHKHYVLIGTLIGAGLPLLLGMLVGRPLGGLLWGGFLRTVLVHHGTFFINSAAHVFGTRPYLTTTSARDCAWLAFFTFGEGYHNYHHTFPSDYRNGVRWFHWDPTKWTVKALELLGLAAHLKLTKSEAINAARLENLKA